MTNEEIDQVPDWAIKLELEQIPACKSTIEACRMYAKQGHRSDIFIIRAAYWRAQVAGPVDPMLLVMREACARIWDQDKPTMAQKFRKGLFDNDLTMRIAQSVIAVLREQGRLT